jgi:RNA polymerase sigma factor (sigma-70 family)
MPGKTDTNQTPADTSRFATTHWTLVLAAGSPDSSRYREALETLCRTYWFPLYAYLRRKGYNINEAEDYTQGFFARLLEKESLQYADPARGKFRYFLLASLKNFIANEWDRIKAHKRGGDRNILQLDTQTAENRYESGLPVELSPEKLFERSWALTVLQQAFAGLQMQYGKAGKGILFDHLKEYLSGEQTAVSYREVATTLGMSEDAIKVAMHRLRRQYRELVRREIAQTVTTPGQIEEEIRDLFTALSS